NTNCRIGLSSPRPSHAWASTSKPPCVRSADPALAVMASPTKTSQQCGSRTTSRKRITYGGGVSENVVFLFRYGLLLERRGERDTDRFKEVERELSREFGLRPWEPSIFDVTAGIDD